MFRTRFSQGVLALHLCGFTSLAATPFGVSSFSLDGLLAWTNAAVPGICTVERASAPEDPWFPEHNSFAIASSGGYRASLTAERAFYRVKSLEVSPTKAGFTNFVSAYGILETIAGNGYGQVDGVNYWQSWYEDSLAQWAALSRPHFAMADRVGNVYVADKNSHCILKVTPDGFIHTFAGTHAGGFNGEGPAPATSLQLNFPNGEWILPDGTVYILDTDNGRIRRVDTNGIMVTLFQATSDGSPVPTGRGLWVKGDESLAYFSAGDKLKKWTPGGGVKTLASNFSELGNLIVETNGEVVVTDRGANRVYRVTAAGVRKVIAGNGLTTGGGDGFSAVETGLYGVRGVWPVPTGGYLLLTHEGSQLWYMDSAGVVRVLLNGAGGRTHSGDGAFFYTPEPTIGQGRSVTMDAEGNILICESDYGYIRRIRFLPLDP
jgi:hypothetical protein